MTSSLTTQIAGTYPLEEVNKAIRKYRENMSAGKILLTRD